MRLTKIKKLALSAIVSAATIFSLNNAHAFDLNYDNIGSSSGVGFEWGYSNYENPAQERINQILEEISKIKVPYIQPETYTLEDMKKIENSK